MTSPEGRELPVTPAPTFRLSLPLVAMVLTIAAQAVATISWAAKQEQRLATLERAIAPLADGTVARLDERTRNIEKGVDRLERLLGQAR